MVSNQLVEGPTLIRHYGTTVGRCMWMAIHQSRDFPKRSAFRRIFHILLSLFDAVIDAKKVVRVTEYLENIPAEFVQIGSPFMLFYLYEVWAKQGKMQQVIYDRKVRYGKMLYYDSTTCWEVFPGFYENRRTRSYCHGWSAAPVYFLGKYLLGIEQIKKGFQKISSINTYSE